MSGMLNYWSPSVAAPARVLPPAPNAPDPGGRVDWLTMAVVVCIATAGAFCIVIAMAWVMGA